MWRGACVAGVVAIVVILALGSAYRPVQTRDSIDTLRTRATDDLADTLDEQQEAPLRLILPTSNTALLADDGPSFYQYTDRYFEGRRSQPWQGGQYGFVRNPLRSNGELIYTRFHEGVDIRPVYRDRNGEPLDTVRVIDDGLVVYVNDIAGASSYGKYVVVEHWWSDSPFYSLYAHLGRTNVREGQRLQQGDGLGRLGYTGRGINKRRAHLHFEINVLLNSNFDSWYVRTYGRNRNRHGVYNGINMAGLDVAALYEILREDDNLTIKRFITETEPFFGVTVPNYAMPELLLRYPWLLEQTGPASDEPPSWEVQFTESGFPVRVRQAHRHVDAPTVSMVRDVPYPYDRLTIGRLTGGGARAALSRKGQQYLSLVVPVDGPVSSIQELAAP